MRRQLMVGKAPSLCTRNGFSSSHSLTVVLMRLRRSYMLLSLYKYRAFDCIHIKRTGNMPQTTKYETESNYVFQYVTHRWRFTYLKFLIYNLTWPRPDRRTRPTRCRRRDSPNSIRTTPHECRLSQDDEFPWTLEQIKRKLTSPLSQF